MSGQGQAASRLDALRGAVAGLPPSYFAMVMATGIVSIAAALLEMRPIAVGLFWLNVAFYVVLWALFLARLALAPGRFLGDLVDHNRGVGFFTMAAGTCVLGSQLVLIWGEYRLAIVLWYLGIALWLVLTYGVFLVLTVKPEKPALAEGINGSWLLAVVATQSVATLGNMVVVAFPAAYRDELLLFALTVWLAGGMLYIWIISLIFYRYTFFTLSPSHLAPPYWINMGSMAISTLAGALLIVNAGRAPLLGELLPFIKGFTLLFWSTATLWIPMLVLLGIWRHVYRRFPLAYDPAYWGAVFPLGMYTVCSYRLGQGLEQPSLMTIAEYFVYVALAAWLLTAFGLFRSLFRGMRPAAPPAVVSQGQRS